jgi:hypothetical protein
MSTTGRLSGKLSQTQWQNGLVGTGDGTGLSAGESPGDLFLRVSDCALLAFGGSYPFALKKQSIYDQQRLDLRRLS